MSQPQSELETAMDRARTVERADDRQASQDRFDQIERISDALQDAGKRRS